MESSDGGDRPPRRASFRLSFKSPRSRSGSGSGLLSPTSSSPVVAPTLNLPTSPKEGRTGSLSSRSGSLSGRAGSFSGRAGSFSGRRMSVVQAPTETILRKHLPVLMGTQALFPDLQIPLFLVAVGRFVRDHAQETGMLEPCTPVETQQVERIFREVSSGREYHFRPPVSLRVVFRALLDFLNAIPAPSIVSFEVRPCMRQLVAAGLSKTLTLQQCIEFMEMLPSLNRLVLLELLHICGMICESSLSNGCKPLNVCAAVGRIAFAEQYTVVLDEGEDVLSPRDPGQGTLFLEMVRMRRDLMCALQAPPPLGQSSHELLACVSHVQQFGKEKVTNVAVGDDDSSCVVGSMGSIAVRDSHFMPVRTAKTAQPLLFVEPVGKPDSWWMRGEMYAEIRSNADGMPRLGKLTRNARSFLYIPELQRVWAGAEGLINVFDANTGAETGSSISFAPLSSLSSSAPVEISPPSSSKVSPRSTFLRQESALVDEADIDSMVRSLSDMNKSADKPSSSSSPNASMTRSARATASPSSRSSLSLRVAVRMLVRTKQHIWAAGGGLLKVFPLVDPPPPSALATVEEESDITGLTEVLHDGDNIVVVASLASGTLVKYSLDAGCVVLREVLETSMATLTHLVFLSDNMLISTSGKYLHMFHYGFWRHVGSIGGVSAAVTCLASSPFNVKGLQDRRQLITGHEDGTVRRWVVSRQGFESAATTVWKRPSASDAVMNMFSDARTGASINPEEVEVDRSSALSSGMFGVTYRGCFRHMDVAVKELSLESFTKEEIAEFESELEAVKVPHERWCTLFCHSVTNSKKAVLVTRSYKCTLYELLKQGKMRQRLRLQIVDQVARYLSFLHAFEPPLLHLDITTSSVVIDPDYNVLVDDLHGLGRIRNLHTDPTSAKMYKSQRVLPPEMLKGGVRRRDLTPAADVYQFGMLLWAVLQQENPFHDVISTSELVDIVCVRNERPPTPDNCPESLIPVLRECLDADPAKRPSIDALLERDVFTRAYLEHSLNDPVAFDFWTNHVCKASKTSLSEPVSLRIVIQEIMVACKVEQKVSVLLEEMFKNFLVHQDRVHVSDFGEMLQRFGSMSLTPEWVDRLIDQLISPGMYGSISAQAADEALAKSKRGDYLLRFTRKEKGAFQLHVRGSEGIRQYLIVPHEGKWKLKESTSNFFPTLSDLLKHYSVQFNLKNPLDNGVFHQAYNRIMGTEKRKKLFAKKGEQPGSVPGSNYATAFDESAFDD